MAIAKDQLPERFLHIINNEIEIFKTSPSVTQQNAIPQTDKIPLQDPHHWLKVPDVICVYVDMRGSTRLSASKYDKTTASLFRLFTSTAIRIFDEFESPYIDVKGDGVFALFDKTKAHVALAAAVTFRTFCAEVFLPKAKSKEVDWVGNHIGIDQKTVLVKRLGLKKVANRTDRANEVWAGKTVNMAAKLAALSSDKEILISDRYFNSLKDEKALKSCGCANGVPGNEKVNLWKEFDLEDDDNFDFDRGYKLESVWCGIHGADFCDSLVSADNK